MSDPTTSPSPDATPTEALPLADQQPLEMPPPAAAGQAQAPRANHTRTILEVVGGVVAAGLIVVAGLVGFAVGHATGDDRGGRDGDRGWAQGPEASQQLPGQQLPGQQLPGQGMPGQDGFGQGFERGPGHHGDDRDGDADGFMGGDGDMGGDGFSGEGGGGLDDDQVMPGQPTIPAPGTQG
jgi:hypothetical protein